MIFREPQQRRLPISSSNCSMRLSPTCAGPTTERLPIPTPPTTPDAGLLPEPWPSKPRCSSSTPHRSTMPTKVTSEAPQRQSSNISCGTADTTLLAGSARCRLARTSSQDSPLRAIMNSHSRRHVMPTPTARPTAWAISTRAARKCCTPPVWPPSTAHKAPMPGGTGLALAVTPICPHWNI